MISSRFITMMVLTLWLLVFLIAQPEEWRFASSQLTTFNINFIEKTCTFFTFCLFTAGKMLRQYAKFENVRHMSDFVPLCEYINRSMNWIVLAVNINVPLCKYRNRSMSWKYLAVNRNIPLWKYRNRSMNLKILL